MITLSLVYHILDISSRSRACLFGELPCDHNGGIRILRPHRDFGLPSYLGRRLVRVLFRYPGLALVGLFRLLVAFLIASFPPYSCLRIALDLGIRSMNLSPLIERRRKFFPS